eukprot:m.195344 g.195344  ORF g.195344 m.195344 type:complete len:570 (-) comp19460_c0_seq1:2119-3828(-)
MASTEGSDEHSAGGSVGRATPHQNQSLVDRNEASDVAPSQATSITDWDGLGSEGAALLANAELGQAMAEDERDNAVARLESTRTALTQEITALTHRLEAAEQEAAAAKDEAALHAQAARQAAADRKKFLDEANELAEAMAATKHALEAERIELSAAVARARVSAAAHHNEHACAARVTELESALASARALAGPTVARTLATMRVIRSDLEALRHDLAEATPSHFASEIVERIERLCATGAPSNERHTHAHITAASNRLHASSEGMSHDTTSEDGELQAANRLREVTEASVAAQAAARSARAEANDLREELERCQATLRRVRFEAEVSNTSLASENDALRQRINGLVKAMRDRASLTRQFSSCACTHNSTVAGGSPLTSPSREHEVIAELKSQLSQSRTQVIELDRELGVARLRAMEAMRTTRHTQQDANDIQTEYAKQRAADDGAAEVIVSALRLELATCKGRCGALERQLVATAAEVESKRGLAARVVELEQKLANTRFTSGQVSQRALADCAADAIAVSENLAHELDNVRSQVIVLEYQLEAAQAARNHLEAAMVGTPSNHNTSPQK